jgi:TRAP-type C4-dicarboxylate transport system substrate-binding protein
MQGRENMTTWTKRITPAGAALGVALLAQTSALAQETHTLRFNHVLGPSEPYHGGFLKWAERVRERTNGGLEIEVFHSAQLGVEEDIIEQIRQGANIGRTPMRPVSGTTSRASRS